MLGGFIHECGRILRRREARACLLGIAAAFGLACACLVTGAAKAIATSFGAPFGFVILVDLGLAGGFFLVRFQRHPTRMLGLVPIGATGLALCLVPAALIQPAPAWLCVLIGVMGALAGLPLFGRYVMLLPDDTRDSGLLLFFMTAFTGMTVPVVVVALVNRWEILEATTWLWLLAGLTAAGAVLAWWALLRDSYDLTVELLFWPIYRVRGYGPGLERIPLNGPVLVVANHAAWFDPVFLGKLLPRRLIAMLTSDFYDKPILHFLASRVVHCIRVEVSEYRREAPELGRAIAALDRGECVLVFPEGQMRKRADRPLNRFGRGVWHILRERPATPVVVCWIEGGWGSYASYDKGPPTTNKRIDFWRPIQVGVREPEVLDESMLAYHRTTRDYLMRQCLDARRLIGLEPYPESALQLASKSQHAAD